MAPSGNQTHPQWKFTVLSWAKWLSSAETRIRFVRQFLFNHLQRLNVNKQPVETNIVLFLHFRVMYARARRLAPFRIVLRAYAAIAFIRLRTFFDLLEYTWVVTLPSCYYYGFKFVASIPFDFTVNTFDSLIAYDKPSRRVGMLSVFFMPLSFTAKTTTKMTTSGSFKST